MTNHDWTGFTADLTQRLDRLGVGEFLQLSHELAPDEQEWTTRRGLFRSRRVRVPSDREFFVQVLVIDEERLEARCSGSTQVGGHHRVDEGTHEHILAMGWKEPGASDHPGGGGYAGYWPRSDAASLGDAVAGALDSLGASPDLGWRWEGGA